MPDPAENVRGYGRERGALARHKPVVHRSVQDSSIDFDEHREYKDPSESSKAMHAPPYLRFLSFIRALLGLPPMISPLAQAFGVTTSGDSIIGVSVALRTYSSICDRTFARARISRIRLKKERPSALAEHEYLLIDVNDGAEPKPAFLGSVVVERSFKQDSATIKLAGSSKDNVDAIDRFNFAPPTNNDLTVIDVTFSNPSECPLFSTLIIAADVLHAQAPSYILSRRQCYWFAGMLLRVLLGNADPTVTRDAEFEAFQYAYEGHPNDVARPGRAGRFKSFFKLVTSKSIDELYQLEIRSAFETRKAEIEQVIEKRWEEGQAKQDLEETRRELARKDAETARELARKDEETRRELERAKAEMQRELERVKERAKAESARKDEETRRELERAKAETARELARKDEELEQMRKALARLQGPSGQE